MKHDAFAKEPHPAKRPDGSDFHDATTTEPPPPWRRYSWRDQYFWCRLMPTTSTTPPKANDDETEADADDTKAIDDDVSSGSRGTCSDPKTYNGRIHPSYFRLRYDEVMDAQAKDKARRLEPCDRNKRARNE